MMFALWHLLPSNLLFGIVIVQSNSVPLARKYKITMIVFGSLLLALITAFIVILALYIKGWYGKNQYFLVYLIQIENCLKNNKHTPN